MANVLANHFGVAMGGSGAAGGWHDPMERMRQMCASQVAEQMRRQQDEWLHHQQRMMSQVQALHISEPVELPLGKPVKAKVNKVLLLI